MFLIRNYFDSYNGTIIMVDNSACKVIVIKMDKIKMFDWYEIC